MGMPCSICADCCCHPESPVGQRPRHKADKAAIAQAAAALSRCPQWLRSFNCSGLWQLGSLFVFLAAATCVPCRTLRKESIRASLAQLARA